MLNDNILKIGYVIEVQTRTVSIFVHREKNLQHIIYNGELIKNIGVGNFIEIRKGFLKLIGKIEGEILKEEDEEKKKRKFTRILRVSINGCINSNGIFESNPNELPLIGNEAYIITNDKLKKLFNLISKDEYYISLGKTIFENLDIEIPIDKLFSSHIAIFGNTGSGKSNTLAKLYSELLNHKELKNNNNFKEKCNFILFDFNGEYSSKTAILNNKNIIKIATNKKSDFIKIEDEYILDENLFSIICDAREKTQRPFINRVLKKYKWFKNKNSNDEEITNHVQNTLKKLIIEIFQLHNDMKTSQILIDYIKSILLYDNTDEDNKLLSDIVPHQKSYKLKNNNGIYLDSCDQYYIESTNIYKYVDNIKYDSKHFIKNILYFIYIQLIEDILEYKTQNDFIAPLINRLKARLKDIEKTIQIKEPNEKDNNYNFTVIDLKEVNSTMKKILPLIVCKYEYEKHKKHYKNDRFLNIIIDEAHNILSKESAIESESFKDYRLETFEEIIKEGRKFGVFITLASQRPMDISKTLISQAHNYFIHKLVNQQDLDAVKNSISYIDKLSEEYIPNLPAGTCIFSGTIPSMPILIKVEKLNNDKSPKSETIKISDIIKNPIA
ncbi:Type IV secretory pathway, VirB4 components [Brachyspira pilosicoli]|uniref:ATP-binding protein n=1 Tax=Brachyspira pilosicoli TaxID=52584 RepID=UPI000E1A6030|nr:ATP-binding protein [Brachyspira pilosicoli]SUW07287.1 Type IV secretory pathway, VirB4 components [Brachyspira pilosicoli]